MSSPAVSPLPEREALPAGGGALSWEEAPEFQRREQAYARWVEENSQNEQLFQRHVYENDSPEDSDLREHRRRLYKALADGEALALRFLQLGEDGSAAYVARIDQQLEALRTVLHEWHGPMNDPALPESFRQGFHEAKNRIGLESL